MERKIRTTVKNLLKVKQSKCKLSKVKLPQNMQKQLFTVIIISVSARMFVFGGGTPYIQMIGVVIGDLVDFRGCSSKIYQEKCTCIY